MTHDFLDYVFPELEQYLSMGYSTRAVAKYFNISEEVLVKRLKEKRELRDKWQAKINEEFQNNISNLLER